ACAGGTDANGGNYQRASDPWITFAPNGDAYFISLSLTFLGPTSSTGTAVLVSKSIDGGDHWSEPVTLVRDIGDADVAPFFFNVAQGSGKNFPGFDIHVQRSTDLGETWSEPIQVAPERAVRVFDPDTDRSVRAGGGLPDIAVDRNQASPGYGNVYAVWGDSFGSGKTKQKPHSTIVFTESTDGGLTWSPLSRIDRSPGDVQAFTPSVHVASDGTVGVTYYDFRNNTAAPGV